MIVNASDFRRNQSKYLGFANSGEEIMLQAKSGMYRIIPVKHNQQGSEEEVFYDHLRGGLQDVKEFLDGKKMLKSIDEIWDEL